MINLVYFFNFPLNFTSGLNPKGEITSSEIELEPAPLVQYMEDESSGIQITLLFLFVLETSHEFYLILWSLQNFFKSPYEVLKNENWSQFVRNVDTGNLCSRIINFKFLELSRAISI